MDDIEVECIKGVMFFRFNRPLVVNDYKKISSMIEDVKIKNVVFNFKNINLTKEDVNFLKYNYKLIKRLKGKIILCEISDDIRNNISLFLPITSNELTALNCFNI